MGPYPSRWDPEAPAPIIGRICQGSGTPASLGERVGTKHAKCPECGKVVMIRMDGMLRLHRRG